MLEKRSFLVKMTECGSSVLKALDKAHQSHSAGLEHGEVLHLGAVLLMLCAAIQPSEVIHKKMVFEM